MEFYVGNTRVKVSFWFLWALTLFVLLDRSFIVLPLFGTILLHEGVHLLVLRLCGAKVCGCELHLYGVRLSCDLYTLSRVRRAAVYLSAPVCNLLIGGILYLYDPMIIFGVYNLVIGAYNLIPIPPLDGGNAARALGRSRAAKAACSLVSLLCLGAAFAGAIWLVWAYRNWTLLACALYLLAVLLKGGEEAL